MCGVIKVTIPEMLCGVYKAGPTPQISQSSNTRHIITMKSMIALCLLGLLAVAYADGDSSDYSDNYGGYNHGYGYNGYPGAVNH